MQCTAQLEPVSWWTGKQQHTEIDATTVTICGGMCNPMQGAPDGLPPVQVTVILNTHMSQILRPQVI